MTQGPPDGRPVPRFPGPDVVEVPPRYGHAELTALAAANVAYEMLSLFPREAR